MIQKADLNGDGKVSYDEFIGAAVNKHALLNEENLQIAFNLIDLNRNGKIEAEELQKVFTRSSITTASLTRKSGTPNTWRSMISDIDKDNDGKIDFDEFKFYMEQLITKPLDDEYCDHHDIH